jgi:hypothetical protein
MRKRQIEAHYNMNNFNKHIFFFQLAYSTWAASTTATPVT